MDDHSMDKHSGMDDGMDVFRPVQLAFVCLFSIVAGCLFAAGIHVALLVYDRSQRVKELKRADGVQHVRGIVTNKEHYTTRSKGRANRDHYIISYDFKAGDEKISVTGREIDITTWSGYVQWGTVDVVYLSGRPSSCCLKDMVEIEEDRQLFMRVAVGFVMLTSVVMLMFQLVFFSAIGSTDTALAGFVLWIIVSCCCACYALRWRKTNGDFHMYGGEVSVSTWKPESEELENAAV